MLFALTAAALVVLPADTAAAHYSVAVTRRVGLDSGAALELAELFSQALEKQGEALPGQRISARALATKLAAAASDPEACAGAVDCVAVLGRVAEVDWLFAAQLAKVGSNVIFDVTLVQVHDGKALAAVNGSVRFAEPGPGLENLAAEIVAAAQPLVPPERPQQAPAVVDAPPQPASASTPTAAGQPGPLGLGPGQLAALGLGALAVVAVGGGVALGVAALGQAEQLSLLDPGYDQARESVLWTARGADLAYLAGGVATVAAAVLWFVTSPAADDAAGRGASGAVPSPDGA